MKSFNDRYDQLKTTVIEIKQSLEFSQNQIETSLKSTTKQEETSNYLKNELVLVHDNLDNLTDKLDYLENQSRRNNVRFDGVPECTRETWEDSEIKIQDILKSKFGFTEKPVIERAHRVGSSKAQSPRSIVVKFNKYKDRDAVLRNGKKLKGSSIFVNEDVSERILSKRKDQMVRLKEARSQGKIAYFVLDRLVVKERAQASVNPETRKDVRPITRSQSSTREQENLVKSVSTT